MILSELLDAPENEHLEFKEAQKKYEFDELVRYACAISNCGGGRFVLGISNRRPRHVVGSAAFDQPERTCNGLSDKLKIRVSFQIFHHDGKRVLVFEIARRPTGIPVEADGIAWWRNGDSLIPMPPSIRRDIYAESGHDFSGDVCHGATLADLDEAAIEDFRTRWFQKTGIDRLKQLTVEQLLHDCEAIMPEGITYAALVLFGKRASLGRFLAQSETVFEYRSSDTPGPAQQREEFRIGFFAYYDRMWELVNLRNNKQFYQDGLFVFDIPTFNERVMREALLNAVCHRNYQLAGSVFVRQYPNRLVIDSPGGFPTDITLDNILDNQSPRNRRIAEILGRCGAVERSGQGMNLMYELSIREAKALPSFTGTDAHRVRVTLDGLVLNAKMLTLLERIGDERLKAFSTEDLVAVNALFYGRTLSDQLRTRLDRLVSMGIVERVSRGRFVLARAFYDVVGKSGTHTRLRGLDRATNKELLLNHVKASKQTGVRFNEFQQVLPALSRGQIQTLLRELVRDGRIHSRGRTLSGRWFLDRKCN